MFERFSRAARTAVVIAQEDARELRSPTIEVEHVLLGLLAQGEPELKALLAEAGLTHESARSALSAKGRGEPLGPEDAEALRSIGIDLDAVRESLEAGFGADALDRPVQEERRGFFGRSRWSGNHIPFTKDAKKVLELSLREALARKDKSIESGHVLLGILRAPNQTTVGLFGGSGPIQDLRPKVHALLDRAA
ncbi:Clp amino terminal domain-containing protein, pathogenicity island component [Nocardia amikacinitolerans]|uniref:Clp protease N-terminal domain-containing protein n=1 Tax=Nocardia amikacinitolerans TaxID=756689 RepID=UPI0020A4BC04|nr:Clp protease N-terminal domain-containing protein [Nocardia amikacinitolerans]MCP2299019.1 Clp amino terminal domain-containing protein, pathogenicity island component [Nocardia amikacinitolerans]